MSFLKPLSKKCIQYVFSQVSFLVSFLWKKNTTSNFRWNQTKKVVAGLLASVCSMMALFSFFGASEPEISNLSDIENQTPELGVSESLSMEFGLDSALPLRDSDLQPMVITDRKSSDAKAVLKTVSVPTELQLAENESGVKHAVGFGADLSVSQGQVQHIRGEKSVPGSLSRQTGNQSRSVKEGAAVWLTGEIEEFNELPVDGSFRRLR